MTSLSTRLKLTVAAAALVASTALLAEPAQAFCGFYVAKADSKLFNKSSKVVLTRDGDLTAITMASDYDGEPKEFALVIPVPTFIERKQIGVVEMKTIDHLDAFTAPRLVEYHDHDPCNPPMPVAMRSAGGPGGVKFSGFDRHKGVTVEATYDVAEYDVSILSAQESDGLVNWLVDNGYKIPAGAEPVLASYIKQNMRFFVAKVNLERMKVIGNGYLRPLQVRYETKKFMLPLRLGTVNASGPQDMIVYTLSRHGRVETANYRNVKLPTGMDIPLYVRGVFGSFYKAMFERAVENEKMSAVFVEYAWDMGWCDPCAADPLTNRELVELGTRWIASDDDAAYRPGRGSDVFVTRLHVRYDAAHFPEDLTLMETRDRSNFQGRYVLRHVYTGNSSCKAMETYRAGLPARYAREAEALATLTGWSRAEIEARMAESGQKVQ
jgi:hypothetical protein